MKTKVIRRRFRRQMRKGQNQVEGFGTQVEQQIEEHLIGRFKHLALTGRFVAGWLGLLVLLIGVVIAQNFSLSNYYQTLQPVPGGTYNEGVQGHFTNANPLYATNKADTTVSRLVFAGLLTHDMQGNLVGDLATDFSVDTRGTTYTVHLKPNLRWHDGRPLTSDDVLFTYQLIQNPDAQSPLRSSWQGITISAPDAQTIIFKLPATLASFPHNLNNGIVPRHLLGKVAASDLRSVDFNTLRPIGAGPFVWQTIEVSGDGKPQNTEARIALTPFEHYQGGKPKLQKFVVHVFAAEAELINAFKAGELTAMEVPSGMKTPQLGNEKDLVQYHLPLRAATMVFFKTSSGVLAEPAVRQALVQSADVLDIVSSLDHPARRVRQALLKGQLGYDPTLLQADFDDKTARALLDGAGWVVGKDGVRFKAGKPLTFTLIAADTAEYRLVTSKLKQYWQAMGVKLNVQLQSANDLQNVLANHGYEAILKSIAIGVDPDVFVYWNSSQADVRSSNRLNLSEYQNPTADAALESGRTRLDPSLRVIKYKPFLQAWQKDNPALGLYQPRMLYISTDHVAGLEEFQINSPTDRFINVHNWQIREARVTNP